VAMADPNQTRSGRKREDWKNASKVVTHKKKESSKIVKSRNKIIKMSRPVK
jgi:hypothetical protein